MATTPYSDDNDLIVKRSNILEYLPTGTSDWSAKHVESADIINQDLEIEWFRRLVADSSEFNSLEIEFDPDKILNPERLVTLSVFKTLELIYEFLAKDIVDCPFAKERDYYAKRYREEFQRISNLGLDYDFNSDGTISEAEEDIAPSPRTQERA